MCAFMTAYENAWKSIIRPTRQQYNINDLGLKKNKIKERKKIKNKKKKTGPTSVLTN